MNDTITSFIYNLRDDKKELYKRISFIESKKKLSKKDEIKLLELETELEEINKRIKRFEDAIINRLES